MENVWEQWVESSGFPIHRGYSSEVLSEVETAWSEERGYNIAYIFIANSQQKSETRVNIIPAGATSRPWKFALDEIFLVEEGKGLTTVWDTERGPRKTFEWTKHSLFVIPRQYSYQLTNAQGDKPAVLASYNFLPCAMLTIPDPDFFFNNPYLPSRGDNLDDLYSEAKALSLTDWRGESNVTWSGNFFPDLAVWDKMRSLSDDLRSAMSTISGRRGMQNVGARHCSFYFPNSVHTGGISEWSPRTYNAGHYHGAGAVHLILTGEGYSVIWQPNDERVVAPWRAGGVMGSQGFHQHFNLSNQPCRWLALLSPSFKRYSPHSDLKRFWFSPIEWKGRDIHAIPALEFVDEDPWIRETYEKEMAKRGLVSAMPDEIYTNRNYDISKYLDQG